jgi:hypothetical protein
MSNLTLAVRTTSRSQSEQKNLHDKIENKKQTFFVGKNDA